MDALLRDLRYAIRVLRMSPGFATVAVLSLALGISANTAMFGLIDVFQFRALSFDREGRLVQGWAEDRERGKLELPLSIPDYLDWRHASRSLDLAAYAGASFVLAGEPEVERVSAHRISSNLFAVMDVQPVLGRGLLTGEERVENARVAVLSHGFWQRRFGGDPRILQRRLSLDGNQYTIVGVLPDDFRFPAPPTDIWVPLGYGPDEDRASRSLMTIGRLRAGASLSGAEAELRLVARRLAAEHPASHTGIGARLVPLREQLYGGGDNEGALIVMLAAAFVLLIACANVANLLLARGLARRHEIALRVTLGAGRPQLIRMLLTEGMLLALIGAALGILLSVWGMAAIVAMFPGNYWQLQLQADQIGINGRVLAYTLAVAALAAIGFGLVPAVEATRFGLASTLRDGGRGATSGPRGGRLRGALVVSQVALAMVLLICAGLLLKGLANLRRWDWGFRTENVLTLRVALAADRRADSARVIDFFGQVLERVEALPGVRAAGAVTALPNLYNAASTPYSLDGEPVAPGKELAVAFFGVTPGYFHALGIPLLVGRLIARTDVAHGPQVVVISKAMARRHWPVRSPLGERLVFPSGPREIVGVVADTRESGPNNPPAPTVYLPAFQRAYPAMTLVVQTTVEPMAVAVAARAQIREVDPTQLVEQVRTLQSFLSEQIQGETIIPKILAAFGLAALLLALSGVYGVVSYSLARRRQEFGVRLALGARPADILRHALGRSSALVLSGVAIGMLLAMAAGRLLGYALFGVAPLDPATFIVVPLALTGAAVLASYVPARRAMRVDPMVTLRSE